jgi:hypothetical protein
MVPLNKCRLSTTLLIQRFRNLSEHRLTEKTAAEAAVKSDGQRLLRGILSNSRHDCLGFGVVLKGIMAHFAAPA